MDSAATWVMGVTVRLLQQETSVTKTYIENVGALLRTTADGSPTNMVECQEDGVAAERERGLFCSFWCLKPVRVRILRTCVPCRRMDYGSEKEKQAFPFQKKKNFKKTRGNTYFEQCEETRSGNMKTAQGTTENGKPVSRKKKRKTYKRET